MNNEVKSYTDFYISYNHNICNKGETALVVREKLLPSRYSPLFFILEGDYRENYEFIGDNLKNALMFFINQANYDYDLVSSWSDDIENAEKIFNLMEYEGK